MTAASASAQYVDGACSVRGLLDTEISARLPLIEWLASIDSTNSELLRRAQTLPDRAVLISDSQTAGRGRRGRSWSMPAQNNLALSMFARLALPVSEIGGLSLALGVASAEVLRELGFADVGVKWPNDLLVDGRKLGGLLIELVSGARSGVSAVIGLGLNLHLPAAADATWIAADELGLQVERPLLVARLVEAWMRALTAFEAEGFSAFATRWRTLDVLRDRDVHVLASDVEHRGRVIGIRDDGALRVLCDTGERVFLSADVSVRPQ